jgi:hypothetical protein
VLRKAGRSFNPVTLVLVALCFALPFVTVGCDTPGGFAGASPGGESRFTGFALAVGGAAEVSDGHERPVPPGSSDRLPPQPAAAAALLVVIAAVALTFTLHQPRARRGAVAVLAAVGATALMVNQALAQAEITLRVADHLNRFVAQGGQLDPAKTAHDYVHTGPGFGLAMIGLAVLVILNSIGWWRARPRPALVAPRVSPGPPQDPYLT